MQDGAFARTVAPVGDKVFDDLSMKLHVKAVYESLVLNLEERTAHLPTALPFNYKQYTNIRETDEIFAVSSIEICRSDFLRCCRWLEDHQWTWPDSDVVTPPRFWGDPWAGQPVDWLEGIPGFESSETGLSLNDALERFSDPGDWADYEATRYLAENDRDNDKADYLLDKLRRDLRRHLCSGRLVLTGWFDPVPSEAPAPRVLDPDLIRDLTIDYDRSSAQLGARQWVGLRVRRPKHTSNFAFVSNHASFTVNDDEQLVKPRPPGRPSKEKWILATFGKRASAGEVHDKLNAEADAIHDLAKKELKAEDVPALKTIEKHIRKPFNEHKRESPRNKNAKL